MSRTTTQGVIVITYICDVCQVNERHHTDYRNTSGPEGWAFISGTNLALDLCPDCVRKITDGSN